jgi:hypothetical protein
MSLLTDFLNIPATSSSTLTEHCLDAMGYYQDPKRLKKQYGSAADTNEKVNADIGQPAKGLEMTDCITFVLNTLKYGYSKMGDTKAVNVLKSATVANALGKLTGKTHVGGLANFLVSKGWRAHYWNPDSYFPRDQDLENNHRFSARVARQYGKYYDVPLAGLIVDYNVTTKSQDVAITDNAGNIKKIIKGTLNNKYKNKYEEEDPHDTAVFNKLLKERFCVGICRGGDHTFLLRDGNVWEVHWDLYTVEQAYYARKRVMMKGVKKKYNDPGVKMAVLPAGQADAWEWYDDFEIVGLYDISPFIEFNWLSGLILTPPDSTFQSRLIAYVQGSASSTA